MEIITSPSVVEVALNWLIRFVAAVRSAPIFPSDAIDPVLSSASATRNLALPHVVVDPTLKSICGYPATFRNVVGIVPDPVMTMVAPDPVLGV